MTDTKKKIEPIIDEKIKALVTRQYPDLSPQDILSICDLYECAFLTAKIISGGTNPSKMKIQTITSSIRVLVNTCLGENAN